MGTALIARLFIGYLCLSDLATTLDPTQSVYVAPTVESSATGNYSWRIDHHFVTVSQPDALNRVHYCRILVVELVYINGIAFAPDYAEQLVRVGQVRDEVEQWLERQGYEVRSGVVALPEGMQLVDGSFGGQMQKPNRQLIYPSVLADEIGFKED